MQTALYCTVTYTCAVPSYQSSNLDKVSDVVKVANKGLFHYNNLFFVDHVVSYLPGPRVK